MARNNSAYRFRLLIFTLFLVNSVRPTHNQYYYIEGRRPVYIIDDRNGKSSVESSEVDSSVGSSEVDAPASSEKGISTGRSLEDFGSAESGEVQFIHESPSPSGENHPGGLEKTSEGNKHSFSFSEENYGSAESSEVKPQSSSQKLTDNLRGDPGGLFQEDDEGRLPEARLFFGYPVRLEYKESWKGRRQVTHEPKEHPYRPQSLIDPKFYDSKHYYKYVKKRNKKIKKSKKWAKLSSLIQFKYMKYLKELEQLAPDDASIYYDDARKLKKSKSKKKKNKNKSKKKSDAEILLNRYYH